MVQALLAEICRDFVGGAAAKAWRPTNVSLKPTWVDESYIYILTMIIIMILIVIRNHQNNTGNENEK